MAALEEARGQVTRWCRHGLRAAAAVVRSHWTTRPCWWRWPTRGGNFPVPLAAFGELIDGCVADVRRARYETFEDLLHYCRCVAGSSAACPCGIYSALARAASQEAAQLADTWASPSS